jgi:hypothetical protein
MGIKYTNIFHCKSLQNLPKLGFLGLKIYHLATVHVVRHVDFFVRVVAVRQRVGDGAAARDDQVVPDAGRLRQQGSILQNSVSAEKNFSEKFFILKFSTRKLHVNSSEYYGVVKKYQKRTQFRVATCANKACKIFLP